MPYPYNVPNVTYTYLILFPRTCLGFGQQSAVPVPPIKLKQACAIVRTVHELLLTRAMFFLFFFLRKDSNQFGITLNHTIIPSNMTSQSTTHDEKVNVLFVCLGNICRSPLAEAVFNQMVEKNGLSSKFGTIDSCGTGAYHAGDGYDDRTIAVCKQNKVPIQGISRKLRQSDFVDFDIIFGMDANNVRNLQQMKPKTSKAEVYIFGEL